MQPGLGRGSDDLTRSSSKMPQKTCFDDQDPCVAQVSEKVAPKTFPSVLQEETTAGSSTSGCFVNYLDASRRFDQHIRDLLSDELPLKISKCVVSLLLFEGCICVIECSGIPIESKKSSVTRILTSEIFGATYITRRDAGRYMKIQVRDASNTVATGFLEQDYLSRGITLVNVKQSLDVRVIQLHREVEILPGSNLVAIQLLESGKQLATRGIMTKDSFTSEDGIELSNSTCLLSKAGDGGPLFDGDGNFVGMNRVLGNTGGPFMPRSVVIEKLEQYENTIRLLASRIYRVRRISAPRFKLLHGNQHSKQEEDLDSLGYPKRSIAAGDCAMVLVNSFEETFGDIYDPSKGVWGVWGALSETISKDLSQSVVSLASYNGQTRFFACSGNIIKWNGCTTILTSASLVRNRRDESKIHENLRIDVFLPDEQDQQDQQCTKGTLQHCHLHYNVAIVSFEANISVAADIYSPRSYGNSDEVVAVGRVFESGVLMATGGTRIRRPSERRFDCIDLVYSSCEVTKAGIGGPLVDFDGKFVGMNFYDAKEGTPYLPQSSILEVLDHFEKKRIVAEADDDGFINRWPVPKPFWRRLDEHHQNEDKQGHR